jgi:hypothetical protein
VLPDGRVEAFAILGTPPHEAGQAPSYPADQAASLLVHEVHHPYVNPWVAANADRLAAGGQALYGAVEEAMVAASYGRWDYMLNETLVRAQVLRYYRSRGAMPGYWRNLQDDRARGFAWVDALADAIDAAVGEGELRLEFDREMGGSVVIAGDVPDVVGAPRWEQGGRVLVVPVRFEAGRSHALRLNDEQAPGKGFAGKDGQWLVPRAWRFRVSGQAPAAD